MFIPLDLLFMLGHVLGTVLLSLCQSLWLWHPLEQTSTKFTLLCSVISVAPQTR